MYYYPLQPPYILLVVGFFAALTSGFALSGTLKVIVEKWPTSPKEPIKSSASLKQLIVPFIGITAGVCLFMSSGLQIFGFPSPLAVGIGVPLSLGTCVFVWFQLGSLLEFVSSRGMQSLDLDSWS